MRLSNFAACRIGKGVNVYGALLGYNNCTMLWWPAAEPTINVYEYDASQKLNMSQFCPGTWQHVRAVQFFASSASIHSNKNEREDNGSPSVEVASSSTARQQPRAHFDNSGGLSPIPE